MEGGWELGPTPPFLVPGGAKPCLGERAEVCGLRTSCLCTRQALPTSLSPPEPWAEVPCGLGSGSQAIPLLGVLVICPTHRAAGNCPGGWGTLTGSYSLTLKCQPRCLFQSR